MESYIRRRWPHGKRVVWAELGRYMARGWRSVRTEYLRDLVRNVTGELVEYKAYSAVAADEKARVRDADKGSRMRLTNRHADFIKDQILNKKMSPYVAVARMRASPQFSRVPCA